MMRVLYIGAYTDGCTSKMRGEQLKCILKPTQFDVIDTETALNLYPRIFRSIGWRFKIGPFISAINDMVDKSVITSYDIIWVDKGFFFKNNVISKLKNNAGVLIHYTPDTAFTFNKSRFFNSSVLYYDYCITTKSFELADYRKWGAKKVLYCTQGYNKNLHKPMHKFEEKSGVSFIGLYEKHRGKVIQALIDSKIQVTFAGVGWENFVKKNKSNTSLNYLGKALFAEAYVNVISGSLIGLGLLSKKFPELHTTRTIEIPACGTVLATEKTTEIDEIFNDDEVIYYNSTNNLIERIQDLLNNRDVLKRIAQKGQQRIVEGAFNYESIIRSLLNKMDLI